MSIEFKTVIKNPSLLIATGFGVGLIPFAPGTFGSGVGLCLYIFLAHFIPPDPKWAIGAFLIFRFFDIVKPFPIRQFEANQDNAFEIIIDDQIGF